jgi:hypothetical protein
MAHIGVVADERAPSDAALLDPAGGSSSLSSQVMASSSAISSMSARE